MRYWRISLGPRARLARREAGVLWSPGWCETFRERDRRHILFSDNRKRVSVSRNGIATRRCLDAWWCHLRASASPIRRAERKMVRCFSDVAWSWGGFPLRLRGMLTEIIYMTFSILYGEGSSDRRRWSPIEHTSDSGACVRSAKRES